MIPWGQTDKQTNGQIFTQYFVKLMQVIHIMNYLTYQIRANYSKVFKSWIIREDRQTDRSMDRLTGDGQTVLSTINRQTVGRADRQTVGVTHFSKLTPFFRQKKILDTFLLPKKVSFLSSKIHRKKRRKINLS